MIYKCVYIYIDIDIHIDIDINTDINTYIDIDIDIDIGCVFTFHGPSVKLKSHLTSVFTMHLSHGDLQAF